MISEPWGGWGAWGAWGGSDTEAFYCLMEPPVSPPLPSARLLLLTAPPTRQLSQSSLRQISPLLPHLSLLRFVFPNSFLSLTLSQFVFPIEFVHSSFLLHVYSSLSPYLTFYYIFNIQYILAERRDRDREIPEYNHREDREWRGVREGRAKRRREKNNKKEIPEAAFK